MSLAPLLARYDNVILDLDGCVWVGEACTREAPDAIGQLRAAGKGIAFVTNNSRSAPEDYVRKLWSLGIQASLEEVVTAGAAVQFMLAGHERRTAYVIGSQALFRHVSEAGHLIVNGTEEATRAELVVVAGHESFDYEQLREATQAVLAGAEFVAADRDRVFPQADGMWPGSGSIVAALEYATERPATIVGKPQPGIFKAALDRLDGGDTLVIGDRLDADLHGAAAVGLDGAIVLTGVTTEAQAEASKPPPVAIAADLHSLVTAG